MQEKHLRKPYLTPEIVFVDFMVEKGFGGSPEEQAESNGVQVEDPTKKGYTFFGWQRGQQGSEAGFQTGMDGYLGGEGAYSEGVSGGYFAGNVGGYF